MTLAIDPGSAVPPYEQIRAQVAIAVRDGSLPAGTRLPTVRSLATELGLAPNTVARAYRALEHASVVATRGRLGTFVEARGGAAEQAAQAAAQVYAGQVRELGLEDDDALGWVRTALLVSRSGPPVGPHPHRG